jgi:hypothetical protein
MKANKVKLQKISYAQLEVLEHKCPDTQAMVRDILFEVYRRLGNKHLLADPQAKFDFSWSYAEASAFCLYTANNALTGNAYSDNVLNNILGKMDSTLA